jgi:RNA polymerase sigma factor (sigma-70 family)
MTSTEEHLMRIQGGQASREELYRQTRKDLLPVLERLFPPSLRSRWDAEDLFHEAFLRAVSGLDSFEWRGEHSWRKYVLKTAKNCILDAQKRKSRLNVRLEHSEPRGGVRASGLAARGRSDTTLARERDFVERIFAGMRKTDVDLLRLKLLEGLSDEEVAARVGKSLAAVRKGLQRAKSRFEALAREME